MDLRLLGFDSPLLHTLQHVIDGVDDSDKSVNAPTRTYVRDAKAMAATPADVKDLPNAYQFIIDMPGLKSGDIKVQVEDENVLVVTGERKREEEKEGVKYVRMERRVGKFMRKFVLPENAKIDAISAVCQDGVLIVTVEKLPPPQPKKPKTIEDNVNQAPQEVSNAPDLTPSIPVPSIPPFGVPPAMAESLQNTLQTFSEQQQRHEQEKLFFEMTSGDARHTPYFFDGISTPDVAEKWIERMETSFEAMSLPNEEWVRIAADLLTRWAKEWYETVKVDYGVLDWTTFKQLFNKEYVTAWYRVQKQREFYNLNQERMTVYEYDKKFIGLLRYVPAVSRDEECKKICFLMGFNYDIRSHLAARIFKSYGDVYECALQVEGMLNRTKRKRNAS